MATDIAFPDTALQHEHAPRPLPLFLEMVRETGRSDPATARRALLGLDRYAREVRPELPQKKIEIARVCGSTVRDHGGRGSVVILVPSLINPAHVLDLPGHSLAAAVAAQHHVLSIDWGPAADRAALDLGGHIESLLVPLLHRIGEPLALVGYCVGGTMALAAANLFPVDRVATLASPWKFSAYPDAARQSLGELWGDARPAAEAFGVLPTEVLQAAFWSLDPRGIVAKFARLAAEPEASEAVRRFVTIEDWANEGEPLPLPAARELIEDLFARDLPTCGEWRVGHHAIRPDPCPSLHFTARADRIVPAESAPPGPVHSVASGHVGMVVGSGAPSALHRPLLDFLGAR